MAYFTPKTIPILKMTVCNMIQINWQQLNLLSTVKKGFNVDVAKAKLKSCHHKPNTFESGCAACGFFPDASPSNQLIMKIISRLICNNHHLQR